MGGVCLRNLLEYTHVVVETIALMEHFPRSRMKHFLSVDTGHLQDLLDALGLHHRVARSLDFLGSMLKVVAGTPDASDLERSKFCPYRMRS